MIGMGNFQLPPNDILHQPENAREFQCRKSVISYVSSDPANTYVTIPQEPYIPPHQYQRQVHEDGFDIRKTVITYVSSDPKKCHLVAPGCSSDMVHQIHQLFKWKAVVELERLSKRTIKAWCRRKKTHDAKLLRGGVLKPTSCFNIEPPVGSRPTPQTSMAKKETVKKATKTIKCAMKIPPKSPKTGRVSEKKNTVKKVTQGSLSENKTTGSVSEKKTTVKKVTQAILSKNKIPVKHASRDSEKKIPVKKLTAGGVSKKTKPVKSTTSSKEPKKTNIKCLTKNGTSEPCKRTLIVEPSRKLGRPKLIKSVTPKQTFQSDKTVLVERRQSEPKKTMTVVNVPLKSKRENVKSVNTVKLSRESETKMIFKIMKPSTASNNTMSVKTMKPSTKSEKIMPVKTIKPSREPEKAMSVVKEKPIVVPENTISNNAIEMPLNSESEEIKTVKHFIPSRPNESEKAVAVTSSFNKSEIGMLVASATLNSNSETTLSIRKSKQQSIESANTTSIKRVTRRGESEKPTALKSATLNIDSEKLAPKHVTPTRPSESEKSASVTTSVMSNCDSENVLSTKDVLPSGHIESEKRLSVESVASSDTTEEALLVTSVLQESSVSERTMPIQRKESDIGLKGSMSIKTVTPINNDSEDINSVNNVAPRTVSEPRKRRSVQRLSLKNKSRKETAVNAVHPGYKSEKAMAAASATVDRESEMEVLVKNETSVSKLTENTIGSVDSVPTTTDSENSTLVKIVLARCEAANDMSVKTVTPLSGSEGVNTVKNVPPCDEEVKTLSSKSRLPNSDPIEPVSVKNVQLTADPHETMFVKSVPPSAEPYKMISVKSVTPGTEPVKTMPVRSVTSSPEPVKTMPVKSVTPVIKPVKIMSVKTGPPSGDPVKTMSVLNVPPNAAPVKTTSVKGLPSTAEPINTMSVTTVTPSAELVKTVPFPSVTPIAESVKTVPIQSVTPTAEPVKTVPVQSVTPTAEPDKTTSVKSVPPSAEPVKTTSVKSVPPSAEPVKTTSVKSVLPCVEPVKARPMSVKSVPPSAEPVKTTSVKSVLPCVEPVKARPMSVKSVPPSAEPVKTTSVKGVPPSAEPVKTTSVKSVLPCVEPVKARPMSVKSVPPSAEPVKTTSVKSVLPCVEPVKARPMSVKSVPPSAEPVKTTSVKSVLPCVEPVRARPMSVKGVPPSAEPVKTTSVKSVLPCVEPVKARPMSVKSVPPSAEPVKTTSVKSVLPCVEPVKARPMSVKSVPPSAEPVKTTSVKGVPPSAEPVKTTSVKSVPPSAEPVKTTSVKSVLPCVEPVKARPMSVKSVPPSAEPVKTTSVKSVLPCVEPVKARPMPVKSVIPCSEPVETMPVKSVTPCSEPVKAMPVKSVTPCSEPVETMSVKSLLPFAEPVKIKSVNSKPPSAEPVETMPVISVTLCSEPVETMPVKSVIPCSEPVENMPVKSVTPCSEPVKAMPVKSVTPCSEPVETMPVKSVTPCSEPVETMLVKGETPCSEPVIAMPVKSVTPCSEPVKAMPVKSETPCSEPVKAMSVKSVIPCSEPVETMPVKSVTPYSEPVKAMPVKSETPCSEPVKAMPVKSVIPCSEPVETMPVKSVTPCSEPVKAMPVKSVTPCSKPVETMPVKSVTPCSEAVETMPVKRVIPCSEPVKAMPVKSATPCSEPVKAMPVKSVTPCSQPVETMPVKGVIPCSEPVETMSVKSVPPSTESVKNVSFKILPPSSEPVKPNLVKSVPPSAEPVKTMSVKSSTPLSDTEGLKSVKSLTESIEPVKTMSVNSLIPSAEPVKTMLGQSVTPSIEYVKTMSLKSVTPSAESVKTMSVKSLTPLSDSEGLKSVKSVIPSAEPVKTMSVKSVTTCCESVKTRTFENAPPTSDLVVQTSVDSLEQSGGRVHKSLDSATPMGDLVTIPSVERSSNTFVSVKRLTGECDIGVNLEEKSSGESAISCDVENTVSAEESSCIGLEMEVTVETPSDCPFEREAAIQQLPKNSLENEIKTSTENLISSHGLETSIVVSDSVLANCEETNEICSKTSVSETSSEQVKTDHNASNLGGQVILSPAEKSEPLKTASSQDDDTTKEVLVSKSKDLMISFGVDDAQQSSDSISACPSRNVIEKTAISYLEMNVPATLNSSLSNSRNVPQTPSVSKSEGPTISLLEDESRISSVSTSVDLETEDQSKNVIEKSISPLQTDVKVTLNSAASNSNLLSGVKTNHETSRCLREQRPLKFKGDELLPAPQLKRIVPSMIPNFNKEHLCVPEKIQECENIQNSEQENKRETQLKVIDNNKTYVDNILHCSACPFEESYIREESLLASNESVGIIEQHTSKVPDKRCIDQLASEPKNPKVLKKKKPNNGAKCDLTQPSKKVKGSASSETGKKLKKRKMEVVSIIEPVLKGAKRNYTQASIQHSEELLNRTAPVTICRPADIPRLEKAKLSPSSTVSTSNKKCSPSKRKTDTILSSQEDKVIANENSSIPAKKKKNSKSSSFSVSPQEVDRTQPPISPGSNSTDLEICDINDDDYTCVQENPRDSTAQDLTDSNDEVLVIDDGDNENVDAVPSFQFIDCSQPFDPLCGWNSHVLELVNEEDGEDADGIEVVWEAKNTAAVFKVAAGEGASRIPVNRDVESLGTQDSMTELDDVEYLGTTQLPTVAVVPSPSAMAPSTEPVVQLPIPKVPLPTSLVSSPATIPAQRTNATQPISDTLSTLLPKIAAIESHIHQIPPVQESSPAASHVNVASLPLVQMSLLEQIGKLAAIVTNTYVEYIGIKKLALDIAKNNNLVNKQRLIQRTADYKIFLSSVIPIVRMYNKSISRCLTNVVVVQCIYNQLNAFMAKCNRRHFTKDLFFTLYYTFLSADKDLIKLIEQMCGSVNVTPEMNNLLSMDEDLVRWVKDSLATRSAANTDVTHQNRNSDQPQSSGQLGNVPNLSSTSSTTAGQHSLPTSSSTSTLVSTSLSQNGPPLLSRPLFQVNIPSASGAPPSTIQRPPHPVAAPTSSPNTVTVQQLCNAVITKHMLGESASARVQVPCTSSSESSSRHQNMPVVTACSSGQQQSSSKPSSVYKRNLPDSRPSGVPSESSARNSVIIQNQLGPQDANPVSTSPQYQQQVPRQTINSHGTGVPTTSMQSSSRNSSSLRQQNSTQPTTSTSTRPSPHDSRRVHNELNTPAVSSQRSAATNSSDAAPQPHPQAARLSQQRYDQMRTQANNARVSGGAAVVTRANAQLSTPRYSRPVDAPVHATNAREMRTQSSVAMQAPDFSNVPTQQSVYSSNVQPQDNVTPAVTRANVQLSMPRHSRPVDAPVHATNAREMRTQSGVVMQAPDFSNVSTQRSVDSSNVSPTVTQANAQLSMPRYFQPVDALLNTAVAREMRTQSNAMQAPDFSNVSTEQGVRSSNVRPLNRGAAAAATHNALALQNPSDGRQIDAATSSNAPTSQTYTTNPASARNHNIAVVSAALLRQAQSNAEDRANRSVSGETHGQPTNSYPVNDPPTFVDRYRTATVRSASEGCGATFVPQVVTVTEAIVVSNTVRTPCGPAGNEQRPFVSIPQGNLASISSSLHENPQSASQSLVNLLRTSNANPNNGSWQPAVAQQNLNRPLSIQRPPTTTVHHLPVKPVQTVEPLQRNQQTYTQHLNAQSARSSGQAQVNTALKSYIHSRACKERCVCGSSSTIDADMGNTTTTNVNNNSISNTTFNLLNKSNISNVSELNQSKHQQNQQANLQTNTRSAQSLPGPVLSPQQTVNASYEQQQSQRSEETPATNQITVNYASQHTLKQQQSQRSDTMLAANQKASTLKNSLQQPRNVTNEQQQSRRTEPTPTTNQITVNYASQHTLKQQQSQRSDTMLAANQKASTLRSSLQQPRNVTNEQQQSRRTEPTPATNQRTVNDASQHTYKQQQSQRSDTWLAAIQKASTIRNALQQPRNVTYEQQQSCRSEPTPAASQRTVNDASQRPVNSAYEQQRSQRNEPTPAPTLRNALQQPRNVTYEQQQPSRSEPTPVANQRTVNDASQRPVNSAYEQQRSQRNEPTPAPTLRNALQQPRNVTYEQQQPSRSEPTPVANQRTVNDASQRPVNSAYEQQRSQRNEPTPAPTLRNALQQPGNVTVYHRQRSQSSESTLTAASQGIHTRQVSQGNDRYQTTSGDWRANQPEATWRRLSNSQQEPDNRSMRPTVNQLPTVHDGGLRSANEPMNPQEVAHPRRSSTDHSGSSAVSSSGTPSNRAGDVAKSPAKPAVLCNMCTNVARLMCSQCRNRCYCSQDCQSLDWATNHERDCAQMCIPK